MIKLKHTLGLGICAVLFFLAGPTSVHAARADVIVRASTDPTKLFGGGARQIKVSCENTGDVAVTQHLSWRLMQATSSTAAPFARAQWKTVRLLPGQTTLESATIHLPSIRAETVFLLQCVDESNRVAGTISLQVWPTNILDQLGRLMEHKKLGVLEGQSELNDVLDQTRSEYVRLKTSDIEAFEGKLLIAASDLRDGEGLDRLGALLKAAALRGVAVLWLLSSSGVDTSLTPSYFPVLTSKATIVVAQGGLIDQLEESPQAHMNLLALCRFALDPKPFSLPHSTEAD